MEERHLRDLPFECGIKSLSRLVVCYRERGAGRPQISEEEIESVRVGYTRNPRKSIRGASVTDPTLHYSQSFA